MARRRKAEKREGLPDPVFGDLLVGRFVNSLMRMGKKSVAERIFYDAMKVVKDKAKEDPLTLFKKALENVKPLLEVRPRRVGGATYQVPVEVREERRVSLAVKWLITSAKKRQGRAMQEKLALELIDAFNNRGLSIKKKEDTHRMAEGNRAFAHLRW
jgi:small subunit ribosomal protein S7